MARFWMLCVCVWRLIVGRRDQNCGALKGFKILVSSGQTAVEIKKQQKYEKEARQCHSRASCMCTWLAWALCLRSMHEQRAWAPVRTPRACCNKQTQSEKTIITTNWKLNSPLSDSDRSELELPISRQPKNTYTKER